MTPRPTAEAQAAPDAAVRAVVEEQANDDGLWFQAETCAEAYLQQALRRLHAVIEGRSPEDCAAAIWRQITAAD